MRNLYLLSWAVTLSGIILLFFHFGHAELLINTGCLLMTVHSLIHVYMHRRSGRYFSLIYLSVLAITLYIAARLQFFFLAGLLFIPANIPALIWIVVHIVKGHRFRLPQTLFIAYFVFFIFLSAVPSSSLYYMVRLNPVLNEDSRNFDFRSWDKYSWYLYLRGKRHEALLANMLALDAARTSMVNGNAPEIKEYVQVILDHKFRIEHNSWDQFP